MRAIYLEIVTRHYTFGYSSNKCHQWENIFSFNLFEEYYDSDANEQSEQRMNRRSRLESSLQEMNDGGARLESFKFSCVVSKLYVYFCLIWFFTSHQQSFS